MEELIMKRFIPFALVVLMLVSIPMAVFGRGQSSSSASSAGGDTEVVWFHSQLNQPNITYYNDALWIKELGKRFNVNINVQGPIGGNFTEAVNVLFASGDLPDIIGQYDVRTYNGGLEGAINDGVVLNFGKNPEYLRLIPNWRGYIESNDNIRKLVTLDDGTIPIFCHIEEDTNRGGYVGIGIREDWLKRAGVSVPTTINELYNVLRAFKTTDANGNGDVNDEIPLTDFIDHRAFDHVIAAFGLRRAMWYPDPSNPGRITYWTLYRNGQAYTQALTTLAQWYREGLIDIDFFTQTDDARRAKISSDKAGVYHAWPTDFRDFRNAIREYLRGQNYGDPAGVKLLAIPNLRTAPDNKDYLYHDDYINWAAPTEATVITTAAERKGKVAKILPMIDYLYSREGHELINFGVEGVSFLRNADGTHRWTDTILNDPNYTPTVKLFEYALPFWGGWPKIMSYEAWKLNEIADPDSAAAHPVMYTGDRSILMPRMQLGASDNEAAALIMTDVNTAIDEFTSQVIMGQRPVSDTPAFLRQLDSMGITRAQAIWQRAYDRFNSK
jgi:putative aldouronate transport system substrate-binding protein